MLCMQALDEDQPGSKVMYKKLFEEDREYNQGATSPSLGHAGGPACHFISKATVTVSRLQKWHMILAHE